MTAVRGYCCAEQSGAWKAAWLCRLEGGLRWSAVGEREGMDGREGCRDRRQGERGEGEGGGLWRGEAM